MLRFETDAGRMEDDDASSRSLPPPPSSSPAVAAVTTVAIVGGSYSGLVLANYLRAHSVPHVVFDRRPRATCDDNDDNDVVGVEGGGAGFDVPSYYGIARELGLVSDGNGDDIDGVPTTRDGVRKVLLRGVVEASSLISSVSVDWVERVEDEHFYLHSSSSSSSFAATVYATHGPYRTVVGADGVFSVIRSSALRGTYLIGDARWAKDRWYDLGLRRIRRGGDMAMNDGVDLGRIIAEGGGNGRECDANVTTTMIGVDDEDDGQGTSRRRSSSEFCAKEIYERGTRRRRLLLAFAIVVLAASSSIEFPPIERVRAAFLVIRGRNPRLTEKVCSMTAFFPRDPKSSPWWRRSDVTYEPLLLTENSGRRV